MSRLIGAGREAGDSMFTASLVAIITTTVGVAVVLVRWLIRKGEEGVRNGTEGPTPSERIRESTDELRETQTDLFYQLEKIRRG